MSMCAGCTSSEPMIGIAGRVKHPFHELEILTLFFSLACPILAGLIFASVGPLFTAHSCQPLPSHLSRPSTPFLSVSSALSASSV